jgi:hypothetical protein
MTNGRRAIAFLRGRAPFPGGKNLPIVIFDPKR